MMISRMFFGLPTTTPLIIRLSTSPHSGGLAASFFPRSCLFSIALLVDPPDSPRGCPLLFSLWSQADCMCPGCPIHTPSSLTTLLFTSPSFPLLKQVFTDPWFELNVGAPLPPQIIPPFLSPVFDFVQMMRLRRTLPPAISSYRTNHRSLGWDDPQNRKAASFFFSTPGEVSSDSSY